MTNDDYDFGINRTEIANLAGTGANFVRVLMSPGCYGIEAGSPTICDYDPDVCYELDQTLQQVESENLYLLLALETQQELGYSSIFGFSETWNSPNSNLGSGRYWNPYYDYLVNVEGEINPDVANFFSDANLIKYYENRIRYIDARWGI